MPGNAFVALERLRTHEELRKSLEFYDSVADVNQAMGRGEVGNFVGNWTGVEGSRSKLSMSGLRVY